MTRRTFFAASSALAAGAVLPARAAAPSRAGGKRRYALNPPTVRGYNLSFAQQVELALAAGFDGLEPWLRDVHAAKRDGTFADAVKRARDGGLAFVNGIAFGTWAADDPAQRAAGLEETKRDMALLAEMGCPAIAASLFGMHKQGTRLVPPETLAERYAAVCDLGSAFGVQPLLEYWGHSVNLTRPEEALAVAARAGRANAGVLADVYHTHRGGGRFETFRFFSDAVLPVLHMNDFPSAPPAAQLTDADRVWPGDGAAPWRDIFAYLAAARANPWLSIELFNPAYWRTTPLDTLKTALAKMRAVAEVPSSR